MEKSEELPESVKVDLLGSRRKILFIEGTDSSLDQPLYALLYPNVSVRSRESCTEVRRAVEGLRSVKSLHNAEAYGLIDSDGMDSTFQEKLRADGVYPLPMFSVESLYYSAEVLDAVASRQARTLGVDVTHLLEAARNAAFATLQNTNIEHLASRIAERRMRDRLLSQIPKRNEIINNANADLAITLSSPYPDALEALKVIIEKKDLDSLISQYPVRETGILNALAKHLRFVATTDYEQAALARIDGDAELKKKLKARLGSLSTELE
jgi:hypothetical protein